jgi:hypothetical protein
MGKKYTFESLAPVPYEEETEERKEAFPEPVLIKQNILDFYFAGTEAIAQFHADPKKEYEGKKNLEGAICSLYASVKSKLEAKEITALANVENLLKGKKLSKEFYNVKAGAGKVGKMITIKKEYLIDWFFELQKILERIGILKIEKTVIPPEESMA